MKKLLASGIMIFLLTLTSFGQNSNNSIPIPAGNWKFTAPFAPQGYQSGNVVVTSTENKLAASMSFDSMQFKFPGEKIRIVNDSLFFSIYLEGQSVDIFLKLENDQKMSGKAVYSEGSVPLTLAREKDKPDSSN